jgi:hypothetical protein
MTVISRLAGLLRRVTVVSPSATAQTSDAPAPPREDWDQQLTSVNATPEAWLGQRRARGRLYADISDASVEYLRSHFPDQARRTRAAADRVCRHEFDLLGSGPYVPIDPNRPTHADGYQPIDWDLDPIAKLRFPRGFAHREWNPAMRPGLADIKLPWEIGRCQHWPTLGQAFRLTGDERYAAEIVRQHADFMETNPVGAGVQYVCTMDVAIRAFNWALAFELIRTASSFDAGAIARAYRSLFDVGVFIEGNLENKYEVTSNHFLSNVVGLYGLGVVFADLPAGRRWLQQGRAWLEQELKVQVLEDGADYESSIPYHRLVTELFLSGAKLAELEGSPLSNEYLARLHQMIEFHVAVLRPDGLMPQVGDADDGRLHIFTDYGTWPPQDGRHLAGPAALFLQQPSWLAIGGHDALWESAWWGCDVKAAQAAPAPAARARLFEHAGIAVAKTDRAYLLVTNGRVGTNGFGNHKHNDLLGVEFHADGEPLLVDPGSYVYTSNPDARNLFRGTPYHNTIEIDGVEQNDLRPDYLFRMFETSSVEHLRFEETPALVEYRGRHTGYERLPAPVVHERAIRLVKDPGALLIVDVLRGSGSHTIRWHFHLAPGVDVERLGTGAVALITKTGRWRFRADEALSIEVADAWYSPSYGVRIACRAIDITATVHIDGNRSYIFTIGPDTWMDSSAAAAEAAALHTSANAVIQKEPQAH